MEQPQNIRSLFADAKAAKEALETRSDTTTEAFQHDLSAAIASFEECQRLIDSLSLFSSNESLEDIATGDLQYLAVDYQLAELTQRSPGRDREAVLRRALMHYERYLARVDEYGLLPASSKQLYEQYCDNPSSFFLAPVSDAAARRNVKIARYQQEKELKQRLEYLSRNHSRLQSNEDAARLLYLAEINLYSHQTFQALDMICYELSMLSSMRAAAPAERQPAAVDDPRSRRTAPADPNAYSDRLDPPLGQLLQAGRLGPLLSREGKPLQPFTLLDRRTQLRQGVFGPGHNLPTMTIDEYLEEEKKRGGIIEGGGDQSAMRPEVDEDNMDHADEETIKARAWDEFKEANPRGSGNTLNRG